MSVDDKQHLSEVVFSALVGFDQKKFQANVAMPPAPVRVPNQRPLAPSVTSVTSVTNDKGDNEMIPGAVHRYPGICLRGNSLIT